MINFAIEIAWGVAFICLWKFFSELTKDSEITHKTHFWGNVAVALIMFLYFTAIVVFDFLCPVLSFMYDRNLSNFDWVHLFYNVYYLRFLLDFVSCTLILCLLYRFGSRTKKSLDVNNVDDNDGLLSTEPRS